MRKYRKYVALALVLLVGFAGGTVLGQSALQPYANAINRVIFWRNVTQDMPDLGVELNDMAVLRIIQIGQWIEPAYMDKLEATSTSGKRMAVLSYAWTLFVNETQQGVRYTHQDMIDLDRQANYIVTYTETGEVPTAGDVTTGSLEVVDGGSITVGKFDIDWGSPEVGQPYELSSRE